jgi:hypothetical protein
MSVSNNFNFSLTRNDIIYEAYRLASIIDPVETLSSTEITNASQSLNIIMKNLMARGLRLWSYESAILIPTIGQSEYTLSESGDRFILKNDFIQTKLSVAIASSDTSFTVASGSGIAVSDTIGVLNSSNVFVWRTVSNVATNVITVSSAFTSAFAVDAKVYSYTARITKPLSISDATVQYDTNSEIGISKMSMNEYQALSYKAMAGNPTQYYYQPKIDEGRLFLYPQSENESQYINLVIEKPFDDLDSSTDTIPSPNEFYDIIIYTLAQRLAMQNGFYSKASILGAEVERLFSLQRLHDFEDSSMSVGFSEGIFD